MTSSATRRSLAAFAAALGLALLAAPAAHAFTIYESGVVTNSDGSRSAITAPDKRVSGFGTGTSQGGTYSHGNGTIQFGGRPSFDQRYDNSRMFNPIGRPGEDR